MRALQEGEVVGGRAGGAKEALDMVREGRLEKGAAGCKFVREMREMICTILK